MLKRFVIMWVAVLALYAPRPAAAIEARIKDIARIDGLQSVELVGYGVVVGLSGTGDKDIELTKRTMANILQNFQISLSAKDVKSKNVAAVIVTAVAPYFHQAGDKVDIHVASIGDATSLEGGILLMTPLLDPEGGLYALAQGAMTVGGYTAGSGGAGGQTESKNYTTIGRIPGGATLNQKQVNSFVQNGLIRLVLRNPDFTTANRMVDVINSKFEGVALARDASTIAVRVPESVMDIGQIANFVAGLETLSVVPDIQSRVVVNERTGTIVMGADVHIGEAVIAHGNLTVRIGSTLTTYMPESLTAASPVTTDQVTTQTREEKAKVLLFPGNASVKDLADMLNQIGATPRDLISILEALQKLGVLQMELVTM